MSHSTIKRPRRRSFYTCVFASKCRYYSFTDYGCPHRPIIKKSVFWQDAPRGGSLEPEDDVTDMDLEKMGIHANMTLEEVTRKLKEREEQIRKDILTEMKIKDGAEKMKGAVADRKSVVSVIKKATSRLEELNADLNNIRSYQLMVASEGGCTIPLPSAPHAGQSFGLWLVFELSMVTSRLTLIIYFQQFKLVEANYWFCQVSLETN